MRGIVVVLTVAGTFRHAPGRDRRRIIAGRRITLPRGHVQSIHEGPVPQPSPEDAIDDRTEDGPPEDERDDDEDRTVERKGVGLTRERSEPEDGASSNNARESVHDRSGSDEKIATRVPSTPTSFDRFEVHPQQL